MWLQTEKIKILYIDGGDKISKSIIKMLNDFPHVQFDIEIRSGIKEASEYFENQECLFDVVLLDLVLPNSSGIKTYEKIKSVCDIPIVIISEFEDLACECIKLGAQDYLLKSNITMGIISRSILYAIERTKLEKKKIELETQFDDIIKFTPLGVHIYKLENEELIFCGYNKSSNDILKTDHNSFIGMKIEEAFKGIGINHIREKYIEIIKTGKCWKRERVSYKNYNIEGNFYIYAFRIGKNRMATMFEDVTEKCKMEDALNKSEKRFKLLSEASFEGILISKNAIILDSNEQFAKMVKLPVKKIIGRKVSDFVAPKDKEMVLRNIEAKYEGPYEHTAKRGDGTYFFVEVQAKMLENNLRLTAIRDMTRYKESEKALKISEEKYRKLIEVSKAAIYEIDFISNRITYVNDYVCKQMGYTKNELYELSPKDILTEESYKRFLNRLQKIKNGESISNEIEYECITKNGKKVWMIITATYHKNSVGKIVGASVIGIDITEIRKAQEEASHKEEIVLKHLEEKIHSWRKEIELKTLENQLKLKRITSEINSINGLGVQS
jgi:PAS domain S-box-containing protein